jgi:hypothetical protein
LRTLKGYEAIQVAEQHNVTLYDLENRIEVSAEETREYIEHRRDPNVFVIDEWPDTDEEAEQIVLREFQSALLERRCAEARIFDISIHLSGGLPMHTDAAELAGQRLVEQNKLEIVQTHDDGNVYRIPQTMYFKRSFLGRLRNKVCPECAHLDPEGAFHEICLINLVEYIKEINLSSSELVEMRHSRPPEPRLPKTIHPSLGFQWLSQRASATKQKWKSVLKPIFSQDNQKLDSGEQQETIVMPTRHSVSVEPPIHRSEEDVRTELTSDLDRQTKITKDELIGYLRSVEIIEEHGELSELRREKDTLLEQLALKEHEIEKIEKHRAYAEKQYQETQRDMDVLIDALQIAKRRTPNPAEVIDVTYESNSRD